MKFEINYKLDVLLTKCKSLTALTAFCAILFQNQASGDTDQ